MRLILSLVIGSMLISKSFSFTMRRMNHNRCTNFRLNASLPSDPSKFAATPFSLTQESVERDLNRALEFARLMDRQHGLCTEPSKNAWSLVDAIYETMQAIRTEHTTQPPAVSKQEESSGQKSRRKQLTNEPLQTHAMYFFWHKCASLITRVCVQGLPLHNMQWWGVDVVTWK